MLQRAPSYVVWGPRYNTAIIGVVNLCNVFYIAKYVAIDFLFS